MLSEEEAEEIRGKLLEQLGKLPEEQVKGLKKQIQEASSEQLEHMIKRQQPQGQQCIFCQIINGEIETIKIYEDNDIFAVLDIFPASSGHLLVFPRQHYQKIEEIPEQVFSKMFVFIRTIEPLLLKMTKASASNIFIAQGDDAGQKVPHFVINVIPRQEKDGISFEWQRQKVDKKKLEDLGNKLKKESEKIVRENITEEREKHEKKKKAEDESEAEKILKHTKKRLP